MTHDEMIEWHKREVEKHPEYARIAAEARKKDKRANIWLAIAVVAGVVFLAWLNQNGSHRSCYESGASEAECTGIN